MKPSIKGPDFLIIGAHKSATTSVHDLLSSVPGIFMTPEKEPRHFALKDDNLDYRGPCDPATKCSYQNLDNYLALFQNAQSESLKGESSTLYLYDDRAPSNIFSFNSKMKIIAILRDPTKRAISNYNYALMLDREKLSFEEALSAEDQRMKDKWGPFWHYRNKGYYGSQLSRYYELFPKEQILVLFYEDFISNQNGTLLEILDFLGVPPSKEPISTMIKSNRTLIAKNLAGKFIIKYRNYLDKIIPDILKRSNISNYINNLLFTKPPVQKNKTIENLRNGYKEDREILEQLINKSIKCWE